MDRQDRDIAKSQTITTFYWVGNPDLAAADAVHKGVYKWTWFDNGEDLADADITPYEAVYMKTGINSLEKEFARIMKRWSC